jgi:hypothetical protein
MLVIAACFALPAVASAQFPAPSLGATVKVGLANGQKFEGELLAVSADSLWVRQGMQAIAAPLKGINTLAVLRGNKSGTGRGFGKMAIFGAISGAVMTAACSSVSDGCEVVFAMSMATSLFVGVLSTASWESRKYDHLYKDEVARAGIWSRFPQGWPTGVTAADVTQLPPKAGKDNERR